jgi:CBS domain-containing protein
MSDNPFHDVGSVFPGEVSIVSVTPRTPVGDALKIMLEKRFSQLPVMENGEVLGMDFAFTNQIIHYDIPWNPRTFLQRIGRVERVASRFESFDHYCFLEQNAASGTLERLLEKVQAIEQEWK